MENDNFNNESFRFEEQINKLEQIVETLDEGELPLDELLEQYKEGMRIAKSCREFLDSAQQIITEINKDTRIIPVADDPDEEERLDNISED